jgi:hypothetical protein
MGRRTVLFAALAGSFLVALAVGVSFAQDGGDTGQSFLDRVAAKLGVGSDQLEQAVRDARSDEIDEAVERGDLTQEQADRLKEHLDELPDGGLGRPGRAFGRDFNFKGGPFGLGLLCAGDGGGPSFQFGFRSDMDGARAEFAFGLPCAGDELAEFLGIDADQLRDELSAEGATLATVAEAHGKSRDELKAFLLSEIASRLDQAVSDGHLTRENADSIREKLEGSVDSLIDGSLSGAGFGFELHHGGFPGKGALGFGVGVDVDAVAEFLGISDDQLEDELAAEGATLGSVAQAHGKTRDELKSFLRAASDARVDQAVASGRLTEDEGAKIKANTAEHIDTLIDTRVPAFKWRGPFGDPPPFPGGPNEDTTPEEQSGTTFRS